MKAKSPAKTASRSVTKEKAPAPKPAAKKVVKAKSTPAKKAPKAAAKKTLRVAEAKASAASKGAAKGAGGGVDVGGKAPSFALTDQAGREVTSESLRGAPYVLYFYPKDDTPGCTKEACDFRDRASAFGRKKVRVIGVSPDSTASHERFAKKYGLSFTLLSDPDKKLISAYGVWVKKQNYGREYLGVLRSTFLVDAGGVVRKAYRGVRVPGHADDVLERLAEL
jgi:peroxiredoxin Q/BCP